MLKRQNHDTAHDRNLSGCDLRNRNDIVWTSRHIANRDTGILMNEIPGNMSRNPQTTKSPHARISELRVLRRRYSVSFVIMLRRVSRAALPTSPWSALAATLDLLLWLLLLLVLFFFSSYKHTYTHIYMYI
jgi:hypothetical protein